MRAFKLTSILLTGALLFAGCNRLPDDEQSIVEPNAPTGYETRAEYEGDVPPARENLDLGAVGQLLERADSAEEFERLLNEDNGVNNLDLNGDGYADYLSVREFDERYDDERGFSIFDMFGPDQIQEIATVIFDRDGGRYPGARVLLTGNEQIYGDDNYYETNWLDRTLPLVSWLFGDRDDYYESPYYYENYPDYYEPYTIVETPVYRTRIAEYYPAPVFIRTAQPSLTEVRIESPYRDRSIDRIYSKLARPTRAQVEFQQRNPGPPPFVRERQERKNGFDKPGRGPAPESFFKDDRPRPEKREKPGRPERAGRDDRPPKLDRPERPQPPKFDRPERQPKAERQPKFDRPQQMKAPKQENRPQPNMGGGGNKGGGNKGGGNGGGGGNKGGGNGGGGGNKGGGGGGKGKGKG